MKKKNVINLIKYYSENNSNAFRNEAYKIADDFSKNGDDALAEYIMALLSDVNTFVPQIDKNNQFLTKVNTDNLEMLRLPEVISEDVLGIVNAANHHVGLNKYLFQGKPGTGKTECVKYVAKLMKRELYSVNFEELIDSHLGQTQKNIISLFEIINSFSYPEKTVVLFDEIDALAMDRNQNNDLREMGRAATTMLKGLDSMNDKIILIATTNLYEHFDKAIIRRFDYIVDFNRYTKQDLLEVADAYLNYYLKEFNISYRNNRLFRKTIELSKSPIMPGEMKNIIRTSIAFSNPNDPSDYLKRLYTAITEKKPTDLLELKSEGFTTREIEELTSISRSKVSRTLRGSENE